MSDNLQKLVGLVAMTVLVVLGVVLTNDDDTDYSRNRSFRETAGTFAGADRVEEADCCDQTLALLGSLQNQISGVKASLVEVEKSLNTLGSPPGSTQLVVDQILAACALEAANDAHWDEEDHAECVALRIEGLPVEFAREIVLTIGHGFVFKGTTLPKTHPNFVSSDSFTTSDELCEPWNWGTRPSPRVMIDVDALIGIDKVREADADWEEDKKDGTYGWKTYKNLRCD